MKKFLLKVLGVEEEDSGSVLLLLAKTFFMGIFIATYDVGTSSMFLDDKSGWTSENLPEAFVFSGILGIVFASLFAFLQKRMSFNKLAILNLVVITLIVSSVRIGLEISHDKYLVLVAYILNVPLNVILFLSFWGLLGRMFNIRKAKEVEGVLDTGQIIATILAFLMVTLAIDYIGGAEKRGNENLLIISSFSIFAVLLFEIFIVTKYGKNSARKVMVNPAETNQSSYSKLLKSRYFNQMALFMLASMAVVYFVEYSFLTATSAEYTKLTQDGKPIIDPITHRVQIDGESLGQFLGLIGAGIMVITILIQKLVYDRIIAMYGLKMGLVILPVLLGLFTLLSSLIGFIPDAFILFFLAISLSKLFAASLRDAVEDPSFKMLFQPLDSRIRFDVQAKVEGVVNQFAVVIAGGVLFGISKFHFMEPIHFTYFLFFILVAYAYVALKVYNEYRHTLQKTLSDQKSSGTKVKTNYSISKVLDGELAGHASGRIIYTMKVIEKVEPLMLETSSLKMVYNASPEVRKYALEKICQLKPAGAIIPIKNCLKIEDNKEVRELALKAIEQLSEDETVIYSREKLIQLSRSRNARDREFLAKILRKAIAADNEYLLMDLVKDLDQRVRSEAFFTIAKTKSENYYSFLIENLSSPTYGNAAISALVSIGPEIFHTLEGAFYKTGQSIKTMLRIVQIYGRIGGEEAIDLLWGKIDYPDKRILGEVLLGLSQCGFQAKGEKVVRIKRAIESDISNAAWNIAALGEIGEDETALNLKQALIEENEHNFDHLYMLLSLIYDAHSIQLVRNNIESGTIEGVTFAIELLNVFIDDDLKPILFPLLDELPVAEKLQRLQVHFPREKLNPTDVLKHIINRDYNSTNRYTKALAMCKFILLPDVKVTDDLIANLFNPDPLLRETAAWAIYLINKDEYHKHTARISKSYKHELDRLLLTAGGDEDMRVWKILFLKNIDVFSKIPGIILSELAESFEETTFRKGETVISKNNTSSAPIYIIVKGKLTFEDNREVVLKENDIMGVTLVLDSDSYPSSIIASEESLLYRIEKDKFYDMMSSHYEMAQGVIHNISGKFSKEEIEEEEKEEEAQVA
ncbi:MAG: cyclic nucleotide-binding domain-containing protein [Cytophagaceae bacterium]